MGFRDHFSKQSREYAIYRPGYPEGLFAFLSSLAVSHNTAWDCATGSGQAAVALAGYFRRVIASDASEKQISSAVKNAGVEYRVFPAEKADIPDNSIDLVTVAQALHWFDFNGFFGEADRVLTGDGILAAWCYDLFKINGHVDALCDDFYYNVVGKYWPPERAYIQEKYETIPFPYHRILAPEFKMSLSWNMHDLIGYLDTWSSVQYYRKETGKNPVDIIRPELRKAWGDPGASRDVRWDIYLKVGRKGA
jgi:SAM-dependent methyltransferase